MRNYFGIVSFLLIASIFLISCSKKSEENISTNKEIINSQADEDCDDKAKKKVEFTPDSLKLSGGDEGCSLEDAQNKDF